MESSVGRLQNSARGFHEAWTIHSSLLACVSSLIYEEVYVNFTHSWGTGPVVIGISKKPWRIGHGKVLWESVFAKERKLTWQPGIQVKYEPRSILFPKSHISWSLPAFKGQTVNLRSARDCILVENLFFFVSWWSNNPWNIVDISWAQFSMPANI